MIPLSLNEPDCTGYSACWNTFSRRGALVHLQAHRAGDAAQFYRTPELDQPWNLWTYIPVKNGERIAEVWCRKGRPASEVALAVSL
jgi:hypothetical protein